MPKKREVIPRTVKDAVLKEFNHGCARCGKPQPHLHHIDEDPSNNDPQNLVPLCPNCHLVDQHNATNAMPPGKLHLFRRYKHRYILEPQFNPIFRRLAFLSSITESCDVGVLQDQAKELVELVQNLVMGQFYGELLKALFDSPPIGFPITLGDEDPGLALERAEYYRTANEQYREQLRDAAPKVEGLIIEMLDYQTWGEDGRGTEPKPPR